MSSPVHHPSKKLLALITQVYVTVEEPNFESDDSEQQENGQDYFVVEPVFESQRADSDGKGTQNPTELVIAKPVNEPVALTLDVTDGELIPTYSLILCGKSLMIPKNLVRFLVSALVLVVIVVAVVISKLSGPSLDEHEVNSEKNNPISREDQITGIVRSLSNNPKLSQAQNSSLIWLLGPENAHLDPTASSRALTQRYAIAVLLKSLNKMGSLNQTINLFDGFASSADECAWETEKITCNNQISGPDEFSSVIGLDFAAYNLSGTLAAEVGLLSDLESLDMSNNTLSGSIPSSLGKLKKAIKVISLSDNRLTGSIPPELSELFPLEKLLLFDNRLNGTVPFQLGFLGSMREFLIHNNEMSGTIPSKLGQLGKDPYAVAVSGIDPPDNLRKISLSNNQLSGSIPPDFRSLGSNLTTLQLSNNRLTGTIPPELIMLNGLQEIDLGGNLYIKGRIPTLLFSRLPNLRILNVSQNSLTGSIPSISTPETSNLTSLDFHSNQFTGSIPEDTLYLLPRLQFLDIHDNPYLLGSLSLICTAQLADLKILVDDENIACSCCS